MSKYYSYLVYSVLWKDVNHQLTNTILSSDYIRYWNDYYLNCPLPTFEEFCNSIEQSTNRLLEQIDTCEETAFEHFAYFKEPPHIEIAIRLYYVQKFKQLPKQDEGVDGYKDNQVDCDYLPSLLPSLLQLLESISLQQSDEENIEVMTRCITLLNSHGIQHLLGIRHTTGSIDILYPPRSLLHSQFNQLHSPKAKLTVGARALSKHCIRCKSKWGVLQGPETTQNEIASSTLSRLLEHCTWINIHCLPHEISCLEIRNNEGFGGRWDLTSNMFRGFVEPYLENGFESKWRHNDS